MAVATTIGCDEIRFFQLPVDFRAVLAHLSAHPCRYPNCGCNFWRGQQMPSREVEIRQRKQRDYLRSVLGHTLETNLHESKDALHDSERVLHEGAHLGVALHSTRGAYALAYLLIFSHQVRSVSVDSNPC